MNNIQEGKRVSFLETSLNDVLEKLAAVI